MPSIEPKKRETLRNETENDERRRSPARIMNETGTQCVKNERQLPTKTRKQKQHTTNLTDDNMIRKRRVHLT